MESHTNDPYRGIDLSQYRLDVIQHHSFLEYLWHYLKPQLEKNEKEPFTCLEVGCGNGVFAKLLLNRVDEHRLPRSIEYTAIDPISDCVNRAKEMGINAFTSDFFSFVDGKQNKSYDMILFTKSLHHVLPVDKVLSNLYVLIGKAVSLASSCLKENGVLIADEFDRCTVDEETARWFFETCELLEAADVLHMKKITHHMHVHQPQDVSHHESHSHSHSHGHTHEHHEPPKNEIAVEPQDSNSRFLHKFQLLFLKHDPPLATWSEILYAIKHNFEVLHITEKLPFLSNVFVSKLAISEAGEKVLKSLMKLEEERIQDKHLIPVGVRIIATHKGK